MTVRRSHKRSGVLATSLTAMAMVTWGLPAALAAGDTDPVPATVPAEAVTLDVVTVNGSGCPAGSATVKSLGDNTGFTVSYNNYVATVNGVAQPTDWRKNCQIAVQVNVPQGFTYAIAQADYYGYGQLAAGTTGLQRANYYFQGSPTDAVSEHVFTGPFYGRWHTADTTAAAELVFAPCGNSRILNINTELRVDQGSSTTPSLLAMTKSTGEVNSLYHFSWKKCA